MDIGWILDETVTVDKVGDNYLVKSADRGKQCVISHSPAGRMLFDGQDIETEEFFSYLGMLDAVDESKAKRGIFFKDNG